MKLLLDSCVWGPAQDHLRDLGYDVVWTGDWEQDPGDDEILAHAYREGRILVTLDKDFGELAIVHRRSHAGILRLVGFRVRQQSLVCAAILEQHGAVLERGALVTVSPTRIRIRPPQEGSS